MHLLPTEDGPSRFERPQTPSGCQALTLGGAMDGCPSDPKKICMQLHVNWGHASARQLIWVSVDSDGDNMHLANYADEV